jgi:hypothetical protein
LEDDLGTVAAHRLIFAADAVSSIDTQHRTPA